MIYQTGKMLLQEKQEVLRGSVNDVVICQDLAASTPTYFTLLIIKDNEVVRKLLRVYEQGGPKSRQDIVTTFVWESKYVVVYNYEPEREITRFFTADIQELTDCEQLCLRTAVECMSSTTPFPIMYLQLSQGQVQMRHDKSVEFSYSLDLSALDESITEKECVRKCALLLFDLLEKYAGAKTASYKLLRLKNERGEYRYFVELYRDLDAAALPLEKENLIERGKGMASRYTDFFFRVLLIVCVALALLALIMIVCQLIFGDIPFMRIFFNTFKQIGSESLVQ